MGLECFLYIFKFWPGASWPWWYHSNDVEYVSGIPRDFEVEIPTLISKRGIQGIKTKDLPKTIIAQILRDRVAPVEIELEAYVKGSKSALLQLVMTDKWVTSKQQAIDIVNEIFALPYHAELRKHYKDE